jgi:hypothetical protein
MKKQNIVDISTYGAGMMVYSQASDINILYRYMFRLVTRVVSVNKTTNNANRHHIYRGYVLYRLSSIFYHLLYPLC